MRWLTHTTVNVLTRILCPYPLCILGMADRHDCRAGELALRVV